MVFHSGLSGGNLDARSILHHATMAGLEIKGAVDELRVGDVVDIKNATGGKQGSSVLFPDLPRAFVFTTCGGYNSQVFGLNEGHRNRSASYSDIDVCQPRCV